MGLSPWIGNSIDSPDQVHLIVGLDYVKWLAEGLPVKPWYMGL